MGRYDQVDLAYTFLAAKENAGESFTIEELASVTGWKKPTAALIHQNDGANMFKKMVHTTWHLELSR